MSKREYAACSAVCLALVAAVSLARAAQNDDPPAVGTIPVEVTKPKDEPEPPDERPTRLETIEVTASKVLKSQRDIPGSVGAIRGEELEAMHAQGLKDYLKIVPGVVINDQGSESSIPIIRGIASQINFGSTAQTTGIYLDDMPLSDLVTPLSMPDLNPFDLDRVEILKGPQGTLFGSGALAGAIRYIVQRPKAGVWEAKFEETLANTQGGGGLGSVTAGAVNVPLFGDKVAIRGVGLYRKYPGLYDQSGTDPFGNSLRNDPDADKLRQATGRLLASWEAADRLKLSAFYFAQKTRMNDVAFADQANTPATRRAPFPSPHRYEFGGGNLLATYDFDWGTLLSSTNSIDKHTNTLDHDEWLFGIEQQNQLEFYNLDINDTRGFTQELRLSSPAGGAWSWLVGASYLRYRISYFQYEPEPGPTGTPPPGGPEDLSTAQRAVSFLYATIDSIASEQALFGEMTFPLGKRWELTAGARGYRTKLVADTDLSGAQIVALTQQTEHREHFEPVSSGFNPKLALRYLYNRHLQWYALAAKGFQFGGVQLNPSAPIITQSSEQAGFHFGPYKSSSLWNYESGIRTEWLDHRLRFDVSLFYLDWKDLQLTVRVPLSATSATVAVIANVGRAHSEGVEAAFEVIPFAGAKWTSAGSWIKAVTDVAFDQSNSAGPVPAGTRLPGTPRWQWSNVFSYQHALPYFEDWSIGPVLTQAYIGSSPDSIRPTGEIGGYNTLDLRFALTRPQSRLRPELSVGVNNLTDAHAVTYHNRLKSVTTGAPVDFYHFLQPRTWLLSVSLRY